MVLRIVMKVSAFPDLSLSARTMCPVRSRRVETDITEDVIRDVALPMGFMDVKVCAVDETWSGLKLMIRRDQRS